MKCPKCKTLDLESLSPKAHYSCIECGGIWITDTAHMQVPESVIDDTLRQSSADDNPDDRTGLCPAGHGIMLRAKVDIDDPFYLEKCGKCGGIWFDKGEWQRLASSHLAANLADFWTQSWQRSQHQQKNRESFLTVNKTVLGEDVFDKIMTLADLLKDHPEKIRALALLKQEITT